MHRKTACLLVLLLLLHAFTKAQTLTSVLIAAEEKLKTDLAHDTLGGNMSILVLKNSQVLWAKSMGSADKKTGKSADSASIYRIASLTKSFTATVLMQLVEKGMVHLSDPVELYVPEVKQLQGYNTTHKITLLHLATHTSGLEREPRLPGKSKGTVVEWESKMLECIPATVVTNAPGHKYRYSNMGYAILALALQRAAKTSYVQLVDENIFQPLHMHNSFFEVPANKAGRLVTGIDTDTAKKIYYLSALSQHGYGMPAGGIYSTTADLARFLEAQMKHPPLLSDNNYALMQKGETRLFPGIANTGIRALTPFLTKENKKIARAATHSKYAIGLVVYRYKDLYAIGHSGLVAGYSSQCCFDRNSGYGVVMLRNYSEGKTNMELFCLDLLGQLKKASL